MIEDREKEMKTQKEMQSKIIRKMSVDLENFKYKDKQDGGIYYHNCNKLTINYIADTKELDSVTKSELKDEQEEVKELKLSLKESRGMTDQKKQKI